MTKIARTITLDPDVDAILKSQRDLEASPLINQLLREYFEKPWHLLNTEALLKLKTILEHRDPHNWKLDLTPDNSIIVRWAKHYGIEPAELVEKIRQLIGA